MLIVRPRCRERSPAAAHTQVKLVGFVSKKKLEFTLKICFWIWMHRPLSFFRFQPANIIRLTDSNHSLLIPAVGDRFFIEIHPTFLEWQGHVYLDRKLNSQ